MTSGTVVSTQNLFCPGKTFIIRPIVYVPLYNLCFHSLEFTVHRCI